MEARLVTRGSDNANEVTQSAALRAVVTAGIEGAYALAARTQLLTSCCIGLRRCPRRASSDLGFFDLRALVGPDWSEVSCWLSTRHSTSGRARVSSPVDHHDPDETGIGTQAAIRSGKPHGDSANSWKKTRLSPPESFYYDRQCCGPRRRSSTQLFGSEWENPVIAASISVSPAGK